MTTNEIEYDEILYAVDSPLATITLNRPDRLNAWTDRMGAEVKHALARAEDDPRVDVIVLTGAGRGFCAGADMKRLQSLSSGSDLRDETAAPDADPGDPDMTPDFRGTYTYLMSVRKPIIAAINGPCAGMAVPISLACDLRFASDRAVFTTAFARRGLIAEWGISWLLPRLVGPAHALDLLFSGRKIDAAEALQMGLVNRVVPGDELLPTVARYARDVVQQAAIGTSEVASNIVGVSQASQQTSAGATQVLSAASELAMNGERLRKEVSGFLHKVRSI